MLIIVYHARDRVTHNPFSKAKACNIYTTASSAAVERLESVNTLAYNIINYASN